MTKSKKIDGEAKKRIADEQAKLLRVIKRQMTIAKLWGKVEIDDKAYK
jgi:hypothetical protein